MDNCYNKKIGFNFFWNNFVVSEMRDGKKCGTIAPTALLTIDQLWVSVVVAAAEASWRPSNLPLIYYNLFIASVSVLVSMKHRQNVRVVNDLSDVYQWTMWVNEHYSYGHLIIC